MSSRRSGQSSGSSRISDAQSLETKLQALKELLPGTRNRPANEVSTSEVLDEACKYLRELQRQTEDLSEQISQKLDTIDSDTELASIIRSLLTTIDSDIPQASATIDSDTPQASATATIDSDTPQASTATIDSDTPQASATATIDSDTPQASATIDSDTPQASTARSSINPDQS